MGATVRSCASICSRRSGCSPWQEHLKTYGEHPRTPYIGTTPYPRSSPLVARRAAWPPTGGKSDDPPPEVRGRNLENPGSTPEAVGLAATARPVTTVADARDKPTQTTDLRVISVEFILSFLEINAASKYDKIYSTKS
jgi:hypothetical protein